MPGRAGAIDKRKNAQARNPDLRISLHDSASSIAHGEREVKLPARLLLRTAAELFRDVLIKEMDKLGDKYGIFLPKGANYYVEDVGIKLVNKYGEKILHDIAKLNFSNTDRILKEVRK